MAVKQIELPWPHEHLRSNTRAHYFAKARATKKARDMARLVCLEAPRIETMPRAEIFIEYYPPTRRGDVHNVASSLKAYIDGIADAMGCDDAGFRVHFPTVWAGAGGRDRARVVFRIMAPIEHVELRGGIS